jgi:hypothetical protein
LHNQFSCLSVEEINDTSADDSNYVKDIPKIIKPKIKFICWVRWEQHLPKKYIIALTSENSLKIDVEIETMDMSVKC